MIGTKIRGFHHLIRVMKTLQEATLFFKHSGVSVGSGTVLYMDGKKYKNPFFTSSSCDYLMFFNGCFSNCKTENFYLFKETDLFEKINSLFMKYCHIWIVPVNKQIFREESSYFNDIVLMPADFEKMYDGFCVSNKKQMPNITKYVCINSDILKYFFAISSGSKNFFFWAANAYFKIHVSIFQIENILRWSEKYSQLQSKLKKGTITAYTSPSDFFSIVREMTMLRRDKRANDVINSFNTAQKKLLKGASLSDRDYDTLSKFGKLSPKKKNNFIRKMSTIEDPVEILRQMSFLADIHFEWNKNSFLDYYKNMEDFNCEIVMEKGDMVLLKVKDYEAIKRLAKATNWCISKDKKYWNEYVEANPQATQYVIFDFSRKEDDNLSIVGFTSVYDRGITHAHDFQNHNIMGSRMPKKMSELKSFISRGINCGNIYGVLDKYGISLSDVVSYEPSHYKWNRESMFDFLNKCVSFDDYYIIHDDGDKVAFIAESDNIKYFLGDAYIDNRNYGHNVGDSHIIFADFTKKQNDPEKLVFGIISHDFSTHESRCDRLYNDRFEAITQSFDSKLEEYGLPYDIICRNDNVVDRFYTAFSGLELNVVRDLIKDDKVKKDIKAGSKKSSLREALINATFNCTSADYLNVIYDNGYSVCDFIGESYASDYGRRILNIMCDYSDVLNVPSANDIELFHQEAIDNYNYANYIGYFLMLMSFIDNEKSQSVFTNIVVSILERHKKSPLFDLVISRLCDKFDFSKNTNVNRLLISYAFGYNSYSVINILLSKKMNENLKSYLNGYIGDGFKVKSTEIWVKKDDSTYVLQKAPEEMIAHAPRRR
jgi:hypothetical protein